MHCHLKQLLDDKKVDWRTISGLEALARDGEMWSKVVVVELFSLLIKQRYFVAEKSIYQLASLLDLSILEQQYLLELNCRNLAMSPEAIERLCPESESPPL